MRTVRAALRLDYSRVISGFIYNKHSGSTHSPIAAYAVIGAVAVFVIAYFAIRALRSR